MAMEIPTGAQIARMTDGERVALSGWVATERAYEERVLKDAKQAAVTRRREADAKDAEAEAASARIGQLTLASSALAGGVPKKAET